MKALLGIVGLVASAVVISATTGNAAVVYTVASNPIDAHGGISDVAAIDQGAQTFIPLQGGELAGISVGLSRNGPLLPIQVLVDIRLTSGGRPGPILATASIATNLISATQYTTLTADFSPYHISLSAGSLYAFSLRAPDGDLGHAYASGGGDTYPGGSSYYTLDSGNSWLQQTGYDLGFTITAVPEPSVTALAGFAGLIIALARARIASPTSPSTNDR